MVKACFWDKWGQRCFSLNVYQERRVHSFWAHEWVDHVYENKMPVFREWLAVSELLHLHFSLPQSERFKVSKEKKKTFSVTLDFLGIFFSYFNM